MDKVDVSEVLGNKRRLCDASAVSPEDTKPSMTYNAFLGFPVAGALAGLLQRLKKSLVRWNRKSDTPGRETPGSVSPALQDVTAFGELPQVRGSTKITFRN